MTTRSLLLGLKQNDLKTFQMWTYVAANSFRSIYSVRPIAIMRNFIIMEKWILHWVAYTWLSQISRLQMTSDPIYSINVVWPLLERCLTSSLQQAASKHSPTRRKTRHLALIKFTIRWSQQFTKVDWRVVFESLMPYSYWRRGLSISDDNVLSRLIKNERQTDVGKNLPCIPIVSLSVQRYFQAVQQLGLIATDVGDFRTSKILRHT